MGGEALKVFDDVGLAQLATSYIKGHEKNSSSCLNRHILVRDFFLIVDENWTARDAY
jgi:hypothetical protein